ncbi:hypothetical protein MPH_00925 [Macrophomina phaseolina MS6]|uniref:Uncharacterized protein n=1 Tax=Macrophomina phaseolina (strain MS6) TaxID=1126212 RepID=K2SH11_MACPH|nr:hypothetical protein MPH_00925 [Macrophomina phaseolina MS6]
MALAGIDQVIERLRNPFALQKLIPSFSISITGGLSGDCEDFTTNRKRLELKAILTEFDSAHLTDCMNALNVMISYTKSNGNQSFGWTIPGPRLEDSIFHIVPQLANTSDPVIRIRRDVVLKDMAEGYTRRPKKGVGK